MKVSLTLAKPWPWRREIAVISGAIRWDYAELAVRVQRRAERLRAQGLVPGQVVLAPEVPVLDLLVMQHALDRLDGGLLPFSRRHGADDLAALARLAGAEWRWLPGQEEGGEGGQLVPTGQGEPPGLPVIPAPAPVHFPAPALLIETSGSTGVPKAVMLSRETVRASAALTNDRLGLGVGDAWLGCLPPCHVGGLMIGYRCALAGATLVVHEGFDAAAVAEDLVHHRVSHLSLVPPMLDRLLALLPAPPPGLRVLLVGGQALSGTLARRALDGGWPLYLSYGMTETCSHVALSPRLGAPPEPGQVGPLLPGMAVQCSGTPAAPAPIRLAGPLVMAGYAEGDRRPGAGLRDGWFTTGDLGYVNPAGALVVLGRADQILVIGGEAVVPSRVEDRLLTAPGVRAVALVALPDPVWGHRLVLAYSGDLTPADLEAWCRAHLGDRERPRGFHRLAALPVLASGKPDLCRVRDLVVAAEGTQGRG